MKKKKKKKKFHWRNLICNYEMSHYWEKGIVLGMWFLGIWAVSEHLYCKQLRAYGHSVLKKLFCERFSEKRIPTP